jgi:hypothetical protein
MAALLLLSTGCTLKATFKQTTDTTSNITGTTSGRIWWNEDGLLNPDHKAIAFAAYNEANLEQDMARGSGEYLSSLGTLLSVTDETRASFHVGAQDEFHTLTAAAPAARVELLRALAD